MGQIRYFWTHQKILDQSEAQISTTNHLRLIFSPIFRKPEILTHPHFSIRTIFLPHRQPVLFSIKHQYSHMAQSHHNQTPPPYLHLLIYELKKIILEVFLIKMYVIGWTALMIFRVWIIRIDFRTLGLLIRTTITDTIPRMMIFPVSKSRLVNFNNLVIICPIVIYILQIMVMGHHQRIRQVVHVIPILRIIPILIIMEELNREWFVIQTKIRVNHHHLQHNLPPKIHLISRQMRNLVEVKIFNIQINATPIRNHFQN